tara:strand:+ start:35 stop:1843 length:1809 start_codon:yes stop_codon:yes gene_type:complete
MARSFDVVSYNILAGTLGSNTIPWVTSISSEMLLRVNAALGAASSDGGVSDWESLLRGPISAAYTAHFHKNWDVLPDGLNESAHMRRVWAMRDVRSTADLDALLRPKLRVVGPDVLEYTRAKDGRSLRASTLRGVLASTLGPPLGQSVFDDIMESESRLCGWRVRGPAVVDRMLGLTTGGTWEERPALLLIQEYDTEKWSCAPFSTPSVEAATAATAAEEPQTQRPRLDAAAAAAAAAAAGPEEVTFRTALVRHGYGGVIFNKPSGQHCVAAYWRRDCFTSAATAGSDDGVVIVSCGESVADTAYAFDLQCSSHRQQRDDEDGDGGGGGSGTALPLTLLKERDRRCAGFVRLLPVEGAAGAAAADDDDAPPPPLWACVTHLMTTSRDCAKLNHFPGEVRAGELAVLGKLAARVVPRGEAMLLGGDFNAVPCELYDWATGGIPAAQTDGSPAKTALLQLATGLVGGVDAGAEKRSLLFVVGEEGRVLREAFAEEHGWEDVKSARCPTSINATRSERIDYLWHSPELSLERGGGAAAAADAAAAAAAAAAGGHHPINRIPTQPLPCLAADGASIAEPSDHVPIAATFTFVGATAATATSTPASL